MEEIVKRLKDHIDKPEVDEEVNEIIHSLTSDELVELLKDEDNWSKKERYSRNGISILIVKSKDERWEILLKEILYERLSTVQRQDVITQLDTDSNHSLYFAVKTRNDDLVRVLLDFLPISRQQEIIVQEDKYGCNMLQLAIKLDSAIILQIFVNRLDSVQLYEGLIQMNFYGNNAIHLVVKHGNNNMLRILVDPLNSEQYYEVISKRYESSGRRWMNAAHMAVSEEKVDMTKTLLHGLESDKLIQFVGEVNSDGENVIHLAVRQGDHSDKDGERKNDVLEALLTPFPTDQLACLMIEKNKEGDTILQIVVKNQYNSSLKTLLDLVQKRDILIEKGKQDTEKIFPAIYEALQLSVKSSNEDGIGMLLSILDGIQKVEALCQGYSQGNSLVQESIKFSKRNVLQMILESLDPEAYNNVFTKQDIDGNNALHLSVMLAKTQVVELMQSCVSPQCWKRIASQPNVEGNNIVHQAAMLGNEDMLQIILEPLNVAYQQTLIRKPNKSGDSTVHLAVKYRNQQIIETLLTPLEPQQVLEILRCQNVSGKAIVHLVAKQGNSEMLSLVLQELKGRPTNKRIILALEDNSGDNALLVAVSQKHRKMVETLLKELEEDQHRTDVILQKNNKGYSAIHMAAAHESTIILQMLIRSLNNDAVLNTILENMTEDGNLVQLLVKEGKVQILEIFLESLEPEQRLKVINHQYGQSFSIIDTVGMQESEEILQLWLKYLDKEGIRNLIMKRYKRGCNIEQLALMLKSLEPSEKLDVIEQQDGQGCHAIHVAAQDGTDDIVKMLLESLTASQVLQLLLVKNHKGDSAMQLAVRFGKKDVVFTMLCSLEETDYQKKVLEQEDREGTNTVHLAASNGMLETILKGMKPELKRSEAGEDSDIHLATTYENCYILKMLFEKKESKLPVIKRQNSYGSSIMHLAAQQGYVDIAQKILELVDEDEQQHVIEQEDSAKNNAIHLAVIHGHHMLLDMLLNGINSVTFKEDLLQQPNIHGNTAVHLSIIHGNGNLDILKTVLHPFKDEQKQVLILQENNSGLNALRLGVQKNYDTVVQFLVDKIELKQRPSIVGEKNIDGVSIVHTAAQLEEEGILMFLLDSLGNEEQQLMVMRKQNADGFNVLHIISKHGNEGILRSLLKNLDHQNQLSILSATDRKGNNALHIAVMSGKEGAAKILLKYSRYQNHFKPLSKKNGNENNVVHMAAEQGKAAIMKGLLDNISPTQRYKMFRVKNKSGDNVLHLALKHRNQAIVEILLEKLESQQRLDIIKQEERNHHNSIELAAMRDSSAMLTSLITSLEHKHQEEVITHLDQQGNSIFSFLMRQRKVNMLSSLAKLLSAEQRMLAFGKQDSSENNLLHQSVKLENIQVIEVLCASVDSRQWEQLILKQNAEKEDSIHLAVKLGNGPVIDKLLRPLELDQCVAALSQPATVMQIVGQNGMLEFIIGILKNQEEKLRAQPNYKPESLKLSTTAWEHQLSNDEYAALENAVHCAIRHENRYVIKMLLDVMNPTQRREIITERDAKGNSILHTVAAKFNSDLIETILSAIEPNFQTDAIRLANNDGQTAITLAVGKEIGMLIKLLVSRLPIEQQEEVYKKLEQVSDQLYTSKSKWDKFREGAARLLFDKLSKHQQISETIQQLIVYAAANDQKSCLDIYEIFSEIFSPIWNQEELLRRNHPSRNVLHLVVRHKEANRLGRLLVLLTRTEIETMITQQDSKGSDVLTLAVIHGNHKALEILFSYLNEKQVVELILQKKEHKNVGKLNLLELARKQWDDKQPSLLSDIPESKQSTVMLSLLQHAVRNDDDDLLQLLCNKCGKKIKETVGSQLFSLTKSENLSRAQINIMSSCSDFYIIPALQLKARRRALIFCNTLKKKCLDDAKTLKETLISSGFSTISEFWSDSEHLFRNFSTHLEDNASTCSLLLLAVVGNIELRLLLDQTKLALKEYPEIPVVILLQTTRNQTEEVLFRSTDATTRPNTVILETSVPEDDSAIGLQYMLLLANEITNADGTSTREVYNMHKSVMLKLAKLEMETPLTVYEYQDSLVKALCLQPVQVDRALAQGPRPLAQGPREFSEAQNKPAKSNRMPSVEKKDKHLSTMEQSSGGATSSLDVQDEGAASLQDFSQGKYASMTKIGPREKSALSSSDESENDSEIEQYLRSLHSSLHDEPLEERPRPIPPELIDFIKGFCNESVRSLVITQSSEDWREVLVLGVNAASIQSELNTAKSNHRQFDDFTVIAENTEDSIQKIHQSLTVTKKRKRRGRGEWDITRSATCQLLVQAKSKNKDQPNEGCIYAVVPAHLIMTKAQFDEAIKYDKTWKQQQGQAGNNLAVAVQHPIQEQQGDIAACNHHSDTVDPDSTSENDIISQTRKKVEKRTTRRRYALRVNPDFFVDIPATDRDELRVNEPADARHPILLCCRRWMSRANSRECPAGKCPSRDNLCCYHMFLNDIALLPLKYRDACRLQRILQTIQTAAAAIENIFKVPSHDKLDILYRTYNQKIQIMKATGRLKVFANASENENAVEDSVIAGKSVTFILTSKTNGVKDELKKGDCGAIVYLLMPTPAGRVRCIPIGMYVSKQLVPSKRPNYEPHYEAIVLDHAFRDLEKGYPHHVDKIEKFRI